MVLRGRLALSIVVATALCLGPTSGAVAQSADDKEEAAKLYKAGVESYFAADYAVAITKFREGFNLDPNAMFLYNLSLCFSKLGNFEEALENAERAAEMGGMPDEAETKNKARLVAFTSLVNSEEMATDFAAQPAEGTCATNADCGDGEVCNVRRGLCVEEIPGGGDDSEPLFGPVGWAGVGTAGLGVVLMATGAIFSVQVAKTQDELSGQSGTEAEETLAKLKRQKTTGAIALVSGIGALLIGGGLVATDLFLLPLDTETDTSTARFSPVFGPDHVGFSWSLRF